MILFLPQLYRAATPKRLEIALIVLVHRDQELSKSRRASKSNQWFKSYSHFTKGMDFADCWSFIRGGSAPAACAAGLFIVVSVRLDKTSCRYISRGTIFFGYIQDPPSAGRTVWWSPLNKSTLSVHQFPLNESTLSVHQSPLKVSTLHPQCAQ